ncbi:MAG: prolyl oligopeptidase family serine peptidase [Dehalococcoidia bacterium]
MKEQRMFGLWPSPITSKDLGAALRLTGPCWDSDGLTLAWLEGRSDRGVVVVRDPADGSTRDLTPAEISVRAMVGYGGGDFTLSHGVCYFVGQDDQRLYRQPLAGGKPRPITPAFGAASSPTVSPDGRWLVYVHTSEGEDCLAIVDVDGKRWPARLAEGADFFMQPAWSPDSTRLAWVEWDHPNMPWDGTRLVVAELDRPADALPRVATREVVAGGPEVSILQPEFTADGAALLYISDEPGMGHLFRQDLAGGGATRLTDGEGDFGAPAWNMGMRRYCQVRGGLVAIRNTAGFESLVTLRLAGDAPAPVAAPAMTSFAAVAGHQESDGVAVAGSSGVQPPRVAILNGSSGPVVAVCRRSDNELNAAAALSAPQAVTWPSFDGESAHGIYYPPASDRFASAGAPPLVVVIHGGPTGQVKAGWDATAQFFATRGYAVLFPNYRGSTGYGREYRLKLRNSWGIFDVKDAQSGAAALAACGLADVSRLVIYGGSAGGYTVLQSLADIPGFYKAAVCLFGVSNQFTLASDTHKFEARYSEQLLGPLPAAAAVYRDRSPIFHADRITDPVALFQGDIDRVVPRSQSDAIAASLKARGVPHEYHVYAGEGHGWRKSETIDHYWTAVDRFLREYVLFA